MQVFMLILEIAGTVAFAISGAMTAIRRRLDLFGVLFLGVVTAVGGGVLRDVLVGSTPYIFVKHVYATASVIGAVLFGGFVPGRGLRREHGRNIFFADRNFAPT